MGLWSTQIFFAVCGLGCGLVVCNIGVVDFGAGIRLKVWVCGLGCDLSAFVFVLDKSYVIVLFCLS